MTQAQPLEAPSAVQERGDVLRAHGLNPRGEVHWNLSPAELYEQAIQRGEAHMAHGGGLRVETAPHTGRSPNDKFTVLDDVTRDTVDWGSVNVPMSPEHYEVLKADVIEYLNGQDLFVRDACAGADTEYGISVRVINMRAWHNLFAYNMFLRPDASEVSEGEPDFTVLHAPEMEADPERHGTNSTTGVVVNFADRTVLICGTRYAGEIKKSIFSVLNYMLTDRGVLPMHCSANVGDNPDDVALFFGLSGTGKTTLSADPERGLIGDDEHGWSDRGIFNFEGGCYAKTIRLSEEGEPEIHRATRMFGTVLENVILRGSRTIDYDDGSITENTRASYPIEAIPNAVIPSVGRHPRNVVFLTADAFGVLPPLSSLTPEQAMYHFLSGYTAKVAGTERGVTEPKATFSACFGAPFLPRHPVVYAEMLGEKCRSHKASVWLVNTGWTGGPSGVGSRMALRYTRAMVRAALAGDLDGVETTQEPVFGLHIPVSVPGVPDAVLTPRGTWGDPEAYDAKARELAQMFRENFAQYEESCSEAIRGAGPPA